MADTSLKALTSVVYKMAEETQKEIKKDVRDIRDAIVGTDGILDILLSFEKKMMTDKKKEKVAKLTGRTVTTSPAEKNILKSTNSITKILGNIYEQIKDSAERNAKKIADAIKKYSGKDRGSRLSSENFRDNRRDRGLRSENFKRDRRDQRVDLSRSIDVIHQLNSIKLKDFIFAKTKLKHLRKIMSRALGVFKMFKDKKELDGTIYLVDSSTEVMKKLSKMALTSKPAQLGVKAMEKVYGLNGKGGLLALFRKIDEHKDEIKRGKSTIKDMASSCGSMLLITMALTGAAVFAIPAMLGALLMKGVIWLLTGTFTLLDTMRRPIKKGAGVLLWMSASIITFSLSLGLMTKMMKNMKLKDIGMMMASIAGVGLTMAGIGLLAIPISIGSATLLFMGASLGIFGLAIQGWAKLDSKKATGNIKEAIGGIRDALGLELGNHGGEKKGVLSRLGGGVLDMIMAALNMGSMFFMMGTLLFAGVSLGILYHGLKNWEKFDGKKSAANIKVAVGALKDVFGLNEVKGGFDAKFKGAGGKLMDLVTSLFSGGKALVEMATITLATMMADIIRVTLIPWEKYNAKPAAENLKIAVDALKDVFGLGKDMGSGFGKIDKLVGGALDMGIAIMQMGGTLVQMGTITLAVGMSDIIRLGLKPWEEYNPTASIGNMSLAINSLSDLFGLNVSGQATSISLGGSMLDFAKALMSAGGTLVKMGTITLATGMLSLIKDNLEPWENYDSSKPIANIRTAVDSLLNTFGMGEIRREAEEEKSTLQKIGGFFQNIGKDIGRTITGITDSIASAAEGGAALTKISNLSLITSILGSVKKSLEPWDSYDAKPSLSMISKTIGTLIGQAMAVRKYDANGKLFIHFMTSAKRIKNGLIDLTTGVKKSQEIKSAIVPFKKAVDTINSVDMAKASIMVDVFKSFAAMKENKPFDKFTEAVKNFSESSSDLIEALNNFSENYSTTETESGETTVEKASAVKGSVSITNTDALAQALAEAIKSLPISVDTTIPDIRLVVNNETARRVVLTLDN